MRKIKDVAEIFIIKNYLYIVILKLVLAIYQHCVGFIVLDLNFVNKTLNLTFTNKIKIF